MLSLSERQDLFYLWQFRDSQPGASKIIPLCAIDSAMMKRKFLLLRDQLELQDTPLWTCRSRSYLFEVLFSLSRPEESGSEISRNLIGTGYSKLTIDLIRYLQSSYHQKISIEKLSLLFHTNRTTLLTDFKKCTGQSINRYLVQLRMTMAATLLRDTSLNINEICERTGFQDISYFSKSFKKEVQFTPSEYRKINVL